jgi:hypothetical protein
VLLCSFKAQGQKIMFHIHAMSNIVSGVEFVIKTWNFFYPYGRHFIYLFICLSF